MTIRIKLLFAWAVCVICSPIMFLVMLAQTLFGNQERALSMAIGYDQTLNALFGGKPTMTVSTRIGNGLVEDKKWAIPASKFVDFFFGKGHCLSQATE